MKPFDPKCLELADYFLADEPERASLTHDEMRHLLAMAIQDAVEDWLRLPYSE
jgi:hypothetical protein